MRLRSLLLSVLVSSLCACQARIQHGLDEAQANEVVTVLLESQVQAEKIAEGGKKPTWAVEVDEGQASTAVRILSELGLPRQKHPGFQGLDKGLVPSPVEEHAAELNAMAEEIANTLQTVDGVLVARVHLVTPPPAHLGQPPGSAKASAYLRVRPGQGERLNAMKDELRRLIAGSVEHLAPDDVTLVLDEVRSTVRIDSTRSTADRRLHALAVTLALAVCVLAVMVVALVLRMRRAPGAVVVPEPPAAASEAPKKDPFPKGPIAVAPTVRRIS